MIRDMLLLTFIVFHGTPGERVSDGVGRETRPAWSTRNKPGAPLGGLPGARTLSLAIFLMHFFGS